MASQTDSELWTRILVLMEEKLQLGFLEQAKYVVKVLFTGTQAQLTVCSQEAEDFFTAETNQQRLMIVSRSVVRIDSIEVVRVEAEPLE